MSTALAEFREQLTGLVPSQLCGSIVRTTGLTAAVASFPAPVGALVDIERHGGPPLPAEVIGFSDDLTLVYLLDNAARLAARQSRAAGHARRVGFAWATVCSVA